MRRPSSNVMLVAALTLPFAMAVAGTGAVHATVSPPCEVTNTTTGTGPVDDLQLALDNARVSDLLNVRGVCAGTYSITKSVSLVGVPSYEAPVPTLDGQGVDSVLSLSGEKGAKIEVAVSSLTIQNGVAARYGGGINSRYANLVLSGTATVVDSSATYGGGGISFTLGTLTLQDDVAVLGNHASDLAGYGGGIHLRRGTLTLHDTAEIVGNSAAAGGGIYTYKGTVLVLDQASIEGNDASNGGGGILTYDAPVRIRGSATVRGNDAVANGGGIYLAGYREGYVSLTVGGTAVVTENSSENRGGGIAASVHGVVTLKDDSSVTENVAEYGGGVHSAGTLALRGGADVVGNFAALAGGGIFNVGVVTFGSSWTGTVCGNDPDDWPSCVL